MYTTTTVYGYGPPTYGPSFGPPIGGPSFGPSFGPPIGAPRVLDVIVPWTPQFGAAYQQFLNSGVANPGMGVPYGPSLGGLGGFPAPSYGGMGGMGGGISGVPFAFGVTTS